MGRNLYKEKEHSHEIFYRRYLRYLISVEGNTTFYIFFFFFFFFFIFFFFFCVHQKKQWITWAQKKTQITLNFCLKFRKDYSLFNRLNNVDEVYDLKSILMIIEKKIWPFYDQFPEAFHH